MSAALSKRFGKCLPAKRRDRITLLILLVLGVAGSVVGLRYEHEIKTSWRLWRNQMPDSARDRLRQATSVTLYSLYPETVDQPQADDPAYIDGMTKAQLGALPEFHHYGVLGSFTCSDRSLIRSVADELHSATRDPDASNFMCFNPRHGLRLGDSAGTLDLLICLECQRLQIFENGSLSSDHRFKGGKGFPMADALNAAFAAQNIPMALTSPKPVK